jgi:hypothetical protein
MPLLPLKKRCWSASVLLARQFRAVRADGRDQFGGRDFITHFPMDAGLAFIDLDQKNAFAVFCRLAASVVSRSHCAAGRAAMSGAGGPDASGVPLSCPKECNANVHAGDCLFHALD